MTHLERVKKLIAELAASPISSEDLKAYCEASSLATAKLYAECNAYRKGRPWPPRETP